MRQLTALRILQIEEEFNSPFREVLKTFDDAGHSLCDTAEILEIGRNVLRKLVTDMNWPFFPPTRKSLKQLNPDNKGLTPKKAAALKRTHQKRFERYAIVINGIRDTIPGHARRYNITEKAVRYRLAHNIPIQEKRSWSHSQT